MSLVDNFLNFMFKLKRKFDEENIKNLFKLKEQDILNKKNCVNDFFLTATQLNINVSDIYNFIPTMLDIYIMNNRGNAISKYNKDILLTFKENILKVKLELFLNIENNLEQFQDFSKHITEHLTDDTEYNAQLLSLSFYLLKNKHCDKDMIIHEVKKFDATLKTIIEDSKNYIQKGYFKAILPTFEELQTLKKSEKELITGLEYEFWLNPKYYENKTLMYKDFVAGSEAVSLLNQFLSLIETNEKTKTLPNEETNKIQVEIAPNRLGTEQHYFEFISRKFHTVSEMLLFNDIILKVIQNIKTKDKSEILVHESKLDKKDDIQNKAYEEFPGSIHFNISVPEIEKINKTKFLTFLKDTKVMDGWKIRNENVKDLNTLSEVFSPLILDVYLETYFIHDRYWQINFEYLDKNDKTGNINPRIEARYMGGVDYADRKDDINKNISTIIDCVKIAMDKELKKDKFINLLKQYKMKNDFIKIDEDELKFCLKALNNNEQIDFSDKILLEKLKKISSNKYEILKVLIENKKKDLYGIDK